MKPLGSQVIAEFVNCAGDVLDDEASLEDILAPGIRRCGLTLISLTRLSAASGALRRKAFTSARICSRIPLIPIPQGGVSTPPGCAGVKPVFTVACGCGCAESV
jgi:hypothetical protein